MGQCAMGHSANRSGSASRLIVPESGPKASRRDVYELLKPLFWPGHGEFSRRTYHFLRFLIVVSIVSLLVGKAMSIAAPIFVGKSLSALSRNDKSLALVNLGVYILLLFASVCFDELRNLTYRYVQFNGINNLSLKLYQHIHSLNYHWFTNAKTGQTIRAVYRGCESMRELSQFAVVILVPTILESVVVIIVFFAIYKNFWLGAILLVGLVVYFALTIIVTNWRMKTREDQAQKDNEMHAIANDSMNNFESVKLFTNERFELGKYAKAVRLYELFNLKVLNSLSLINISQDFVRQATTFFCIFVGVFQILRGGTDIGTFTVIQTYLFRIFRPLQILGTVYSSIIKALVGLQDSADLLKIQVGHVHSQSTVVDPENPVELSLDAVHDPLIEFRNVSFSYAVEGCPMDALTLRNVSFRLRHNEAIAIVGPTGTGKTTLFRLLSRLYDTTTGHVLVNGRSVREYSQRSLREHMGVVSQDTILFHDTVRNNVRYARLDASDEEVWDALRKAEFADRVAEFPQKLDTVVGERGIKLSGGEKQRISIARCFLKDPPIIVLDEATSALDSRTEAQIQATIAALVSKKTTLTIAHRLSTIVNADLILVMNRGEIVEQGRHEQLLKLNGLYKSLWEIQRRKQLEVLDQDAVNV